MPRDENPDQAPERISLHVITGQTASGKGAVARALAARLGTEIVCMDSMKIYRGMDVCTAKPSAEARARVCHHLLDIASPDEDFSAARYVEMADRVIDDIHSRKLPVLLAGGTPLYLKALTEGMFDGPERVPALRAQLKKRAAMEGPAALHRELAEADPAAAARISENDTRRIIRALEVLQVTGQPISSLQTQFGKTRPRYERRIVALRHQREHLRRRIIDRIQRMFDEGLVEEIRALEGQAVGRTASQAIGYPEVVRLLNGETSLQDAKDEMQRRTWVLARRQMTWLRSFPDLVFYDVPLGEDVETTARNAGGMLGLV
jgi:tRNA dimethylallyltransferase